MAKAKKQAKCGKCDGKGPKGKMKGKMMGKGM